MATLRFCTACGYIVAIAQNASAMSDRSRRAMIRIRVVLPDKDRTQQHVQCARFPGRSDTSLMLGFSVGNLWETLSIFQHCREEALPSLALSDCRPVAEECPPDNCSPQVEYTPATPESMKLKEP